MAEFFNFTAGMLSDDECEVEQVDETPAYEKEIPTAKADPPSNPVVGLTRTEAAMTSKKCS